MTELAERHGLTRQRIYQILSRDRSRIACVDRSAGRWARAWVSGKSMVDMARQEKIPLRHVRQAIKDELGLHGKVPPQLPPLDGYLLATKIPHPPDRRLLQEIRETQFGVRPVRPNSKDVSHETVARLYNEGMNTHDIAGLFGVSTMTIARRLRECRKKGLVRREFRGITRLVYKLVQEVPGIKPDTIGKQLGLSITDVEKCMERINGYRC